MRWRVRTTLADRPGMLGAIADACGRAHVNIVAVQVFSGPDHATDELVVDAPEDWTGVVVADLFERAGGDHVSVSKVDDDHDDVSDATTRYLLGLQAVVEEGRPVEEVLAELLGTGAPDVQDYAGHDVLDLRRRNGSLLRISRAVPFTPIEKARAQALLSLVGDPDVPELPLSPVTERPIPLVRTATVADLDAISRLHERCSTATLYERYQVPLPAPLPSRMARRLVAPEAGVAYVVQVGLDVVAHGLLQQVEDRWTFQLLVEDAWQGHGIGSLLVKQAAGRAKGLGAERLTFVTAGSNDRLLRAVGNAGFMARVERHDGNVHISVPLRSVRAISA